MSKGQYSSRTKDIQSLHDKVVASTAEYFEDKGYSIQADHIGWKDNAPDDIGGYTPDVVGTKTSGSGLWITTEKIIAEVETTDSYSSEHTKEQLTAFSSDSKTYVVIPKSVFEDMQKKLTDWSLTNVTILTYS